MKIKGGNQPRPTTAADYTLSPARKKLFRIAKMPIIEINHVTKEYKLGRLTSLKQTALDDIAIGADSASNAFCRSSFSRENREMISVPIDWCDPI